MSAAGAGAGAGRGRLIVFEGGEGAGKSLQIARLAAALVAAGRPVLATREPGGTPAGEALRALLRDETRGPLDARAEALILLAARAQHAAAVLAPALAAGTIVLCDRFAPSTYAYQGAGRGLATRELRALHRWAAGPVLPDLILLLDVPPAVGLARRRGAGPLEHYDRADVAFHARVRRSYRAQAARDRTRWRVVDGTASPDAVAVAIAAAVAPCLPRH